MKRRVILASKSPTRRNILNQIGLRDFEVIESGYEEDMAISNDPYELAKILSLKKAEDVAQNNNDAIIISGDTFVVYEGQCIGKPKDEKDAKKTLRKFSGKEVGIVSGFAVIDALNNVTVNDYGEGTIKSRELSDEEIDDYVATKEPLGMGGSIGMMAQGAPLIESVQGDIYSIAAFPISKIYLALKKMGVNPYRK